MSTGEAEGKSENGFKIVWRELKRRTKKPNSQVVYWNYFLFSVCLLGGIGIILEILRYCFSADVNLKANGILTAMATYFPALIGSSAMQIMFDHVNDRRLQSISFTTLALTFGMSAYLILTSNHVSKFSWISASLFCLFSLWVWWIANADNSGLYDNPPIDAPTGGSDPGAPLQGDVSGYKL